jgi:iron(III) transport system ATP-binding protein
VSSNVAVPQPRDATHAAPVRSAPAAVQTKAHIEVRDVVAAYGEKVAVHGVSVTVADDEHLSLLGPSGCGKSTLLRCIAGLETPVSGEIVIDGEVVFSSARGINLPPEKRRLSMVFQSYAIWPHMTVFENVAYGLRVQRVRGQELRDRVHTALKMVGMEELAQRPATALSGGQQQRVALARAYAPSPKAILLDEPLSNLDARLRSQMRDDLKDLQKRTKLSTIYVTHDQEEAMAMSDRIIVMRQGRIEQEAKPLVIYERPRTRFVADFIGAANVLSGTLVSADPAGPVIRVGSTEMRCAPVAEIPPPTDGGHLIAIRTVYPELLPAGTPGAVNQWPATVASRILLGDIVRYGVEFAGGSLHVQTTPKTLVEQGGEVTLSIPPEHVVLLAG